MNAQQPVTLLRDEGYNNRRYSPMATDGILDVRVPPLLVLWSILTKRKWIIIGAVIAALLIGFVLTLLATPKYTATAIIQIQREQRNFTNVESAQRQETSSADQEFYQTQYGLLKSKSLAMQVASSLHLQDNARFVRTMSPRTSKLWFSGDRLAVGAPSRADRLDGTAAILLDHIVVDPDRNSQLVRVSFTSPDPLLSQQIANGWGKQFIQSSLDRRFATTSYARTFLEQRLQQLRNRIDQSERGLVEYGARAGIITVPGGGGGSGESDAGGGVGGSAHDVPLVATDLAAINSELAKATAARIIAQSRIASGNQSTPESLSNTAIATIRARRADVAAEYAKVLQQFDPNFPTALALKGQLAVLDRDIAAEEGRVTSSLRSNFTAAAARESDLTSRVSQLKQSYLDLRRRSIQYDILQRDVDTNRQLYAALLQRFKEIGIAGGVGVNNISVVDDADLPRTPSSPRLVLNMSLALLVGLLAGSGIVLVLEQLDTGLSDPVEIQSALGLPLLGTVPKVNEDVIAALGDPKAAISEAYTSIQTTMAFGTDHGFPRSLVVTSSGPGEGKSTSSYAIARRLAQLGRSTVLIDGDMRSPSMSLLLKIDNRLGLSNYLSGSDDLNPLLQPLSDTGLMVMGSGTTPPNTTELLASSRLAKLLTELLTRFDHVVIDSPPVMGIADAPLLASQVEGVAFAIEFHATSKGNARVAIGRLLSARAVLIGAILTKFDRSGMAASYGYDYGYGYGYGHDSSSAISSNR